MSRVPIACTLSASDQVVRADEWRQLKLKAVKRELTADGARLTFAPGTMAATVADLVAREATCCTFFTFTLEITAHQVVLTIAAPNDAKEVVVALVE